jgi:uncharacterized protein (DUF58 family)
VIWRELFLSPRFYFLAGVFSVAFILIFFAEHAYLDLLKWFFYLFLSLIFIDFLLLFGQKNPVAAHRTHAERFSNGDKNSVSIEVRSGYFYTVQVTILDEVPLTFQERSFHHQISLNPRNSRFVRYNLVPKERGEYEFGFCNLLITSPLGLLERKIKSARKTSFKVYPAFKQMRQYQLLAMSNLQTESGRKRMRSMGESFEFDQIRAYSIGDDYRKLNWKASAKKSALMVNQYRDERAQNIYSIIDLGRPMQMAFNGMTLLEYAINASLILSDVSIIKEDKPGLITYAKDGCMMIPADRKRLQMKSIMENLYRIETDFYQSSFSQLYNMIQRNIGSRSALFLYTNFETLQSSKRYIRFLHNIARKHLLVVILFKNTELAGARKQKAESIRQIYENALIDNIFLEKKAIVNELQMLGIHTILTKPESLTINAINKYLEIKANRLL